MEKYCLLILYSFMALIGNAQDSLSDIQYPKMSNPILPGFNPDPSICVVDSDYYLVTSSFGYIPGLPVYHSRDLVHWNLISHAIDNNNIGKFHFTGINDNDGVWAPTIRYHNGTFYISSTMWRSGGNFIVTAKNPEGPWSEPIYIPDAPGVDPTLFWDTDGRSYYVGNRFDFKQTYSGQVGIFVQEIDLNHVERGVVEDKKNSIQFEASVYNLIGRHTLLTFGHATNARYAEGPHIYKFDDQYYLLMAEGGSGSFHAVTAFTSKKLFGPYTPQQINPVLSHRQMGNTYSIQNIGHADVFRAADGNLYAVCLGNRVVQDNDGTWHCSLGRETFLVRVELQDGQLVFAPGVGYVQSSIERPCLPDYQFTTSSEPSYGLRGFPDGITSDSVTTTIVLQPELIDSLVTPTCQLQKLHRLKWTYSKDVTFSTHKCNEWAGLTLYRTANSNYTLLKGSNTIKLTKREKGKTSTIAEIPYENNTVKLTMDADSMRLQFYVNDQPIGSQQSMRPLCDDGQYNKFNGLGVGVYATSMGKKSKNKAVFK